jgi:hypothetical protein
MKASPRADNMDVANQEDKFATSIERSTILGVEGTAGHTMKGKTSISEPETDVQQTITGIALIMTPWPVIFSAAPWLRSCEPKMLETQDGCLMAKLLRD